MAVDAGSIYSEVRILLDKLKGDVQKMKTLYNQVDKSTKKTGKQVKQTSLLAVVAFAAIARAIQKLVFGSVKLFAGFEQSMANVASVARATPQEFEKITAAALEAGETTRFTARQSGEALYYLASAGFDATQSMEALEGVLNLAGATQSDLAFTSAAVASTISQFNLEAEEATKVANIFTAAITNSQATMNKLATSLRYVGPVASAFGISLEDITGGLQVLYNAGFEATTAGTALRSALADLSNAASPAVAKLEKLGVAFTETNPATNSFAEIIGVLSEKVSEGGDILNVFGERAGPGMIKLIQAGQEKIEEYTAAVTDTNAAAEAYAIQNDTLAGSQDRLKSAVESARIGFGKLIGQALRPLIDVLTKVIVRISKLPDFFKILFGALVIGVPAVIAINVAIKALIPTLIQLGTTIGAVALPITAVVGGIALLTAGIVAVSRAVEKSKLREIAIQYGDLAEAINVTTKEMKDLVDVQKQIGGTQAITQLNNFRVALGLTTKEMKKMTGQAYALGLSFESFALATEAFGLTNIEAKRLDMIFNQVEKDIVNGSVEIADQMEVIANKFNLTKEQVVAYALANTKVTGEFRDQLRLIKDQQNKAEELKSGYEAYAEGRIAAALAVKAAEEDVTKELEKQQAMQKSADEIFTEKEETARARREETFRQNEELSKAGLINETERLGTRLSAWEGYLDSISSGVIGFATTESASFQLSVENIKRLREELKILKDLETENNDDSTSASDTRIQELNEEMELRKQGNANLLASISENKNKLEEQGKSELELLEIQRLRAIEQINLSDADDVFKDAAIASTNELFELLKDDSAAATFRDNLVSAVDTVNSAFQNLSGSLNTIFKADSEERIEAINAELEAELERLGLTEATETESLQKRLDAAILAGDLETAAELQDDIDRLAVTADFEKKKANEAYKAAVAQWILNSATALGNSIVAITSGFATAPFIPAGLIAGGIATALTAAQLVAIGKTKPQPPTFESGGLVIGAGSKSGSSVNVAENGSNELLLNNGQSGREFLNEFADLLSQRMGGGAGGSFTFIIEKDGKKEAQEMFNYANAGQIRVKI